MENNNSLILEKNTILKIKDKEVFLTETAICHTENIRGYFILNMLIPVFFGDLGILPVKYVECKDIYEEYDLKNNNIIVGEAADICSF